MARRPRLCVAVFVCVAAVALLLDQITKLWALSALSDGRSYRVIDGLLSFTLVRNPGASLGLGSGFTWVISVLAMVACVVIVVLGLRTTSKAWAAALGCAFAGALGNLVDRVSYADGFLNGKVVDFINYGWSVGNVADIFLTIAGVGIVVMILLNVPFADESSDSASPAATPAATLAAASSATPESSVTSESTASSEQEGKVR
ncbi:signal peptidase II [Bifidobacterium sp. 64T4]|uniref:signal peptidase II n=1 Tax=Bifidobacterium pongonis TaxID=2834432 RepID=UPI001C56F9D4|nr:signal peptidase II [Bifidobacterium pongonis]MBW3094148.1 signal peptidase II [Bifidobacterium pongonis]